MSRRLYRSRSDRVVFGVSGGLGRYFDIDPVFFRVAFVVFALGYGVGILAYIILAIAAPLEPVNSVTSGQVGGAQPPNPPPPTAPAGQSYPERRGHSHSVLGLILVGAGVFFLLGQFGLLGWWGWEWRVVWPLILIGLGLFIILRRTRRE